MIGDIIRWTIAYLVARIITGVLAIPDGKHLPDHETNLPKWLAYTLFPLLTWRGLSVFLDICIILQICHTVCFFTAIIATLASCFNVAVTICMAIIYTAGLLIGLMRILCKKEDN